MAHRVLDAESRLSERVTHLYVLVLGREPDSVELEEISRYLAGGLERFALERERAWDVSGAMGLFNGGRIAEHAAWTLVCRVVLNLDESITQR